MLINKFLYFIIITPLFAIIFFLAMRYQTFKNKDAEWRNKNLIKIVLGATILFLVFSLFSVKTIYLVKNENCFKYTVIGPLKYRFSNGVKRPIKMKSKHIILNDSENSIILESVYYSRSPALSSYYTPQKFHEEIEPYNYFSAPEEITYVLHTPPERIEVGEYDSHIKYWLHR